MPINTAYLNTAGEPTGLSDQSQIAGSMATFVAIDNAGTLTQTGIATFGAAINSASAISGGAITGTTLTTTSTTSLGATFRLPSFTSTSATSATMANNQLSVMSVSVSSAIIAFRSGNTVYQFIADAAIL